MDLFPKDTLSYYATPGILSSSGPHTQQLNALPDDIPALVNTLQNLAVHIFWADRMGLTLSDERKAEVQIRPAHHKFSRLLELDSSAMALARPIEKRLVCNCRDFSLLLATILRAKGIPARARCGFAVYFLADHYEDHWVCEYWDAARQRWVTVDAQLDLFQQERLNLSFNPLDMPPGQFIPAGHAWQMCRQGKADPEKFGIHQWHGMAFIRGNVARDLLSLNKLEVLPWDFWGWLKKSIAKEWPRQREVFDQVAELTLQPDTSFTQIHAFYKNTPGFRFPPAWQPTDL